MRRWDWFKIAVIAGSLLFCGAVWTGAFMVIFSGWRPF